MATSVTADVRGARVDGYRLASAVPCLESVSGGHLDNPSLKSRSIGINRTAVSRNHVMQVASSSAGPGIRPLMITWADLTPTSLGQAIGKHFPTYRY